MCIRDRRGGFQHGKRLTPPHQLCILAAPEALAAGQQPDGLQQIGLCLLYTSLDVHGDAAAVVGDLNDVIL